MRWIVFAICFIWLSEEGCVGVPPPVPEVVDNEDLAALLDAEETLRPYIIRVLKHEFRRLSLKSKFVYKGSVSNNDRGGIRIQVDATYAVSDHAHQIAACTIKKMTQHMPDDIYSRLASHSKIGIFTKAETIIVYPEYAPYANPADCSATDCSGHCHQSCTFDGRKYYTLAGAGGARTGILDDNILCNAADPYRSASNILVHEYAHTVKNHGLSSAERGHVNTAYHHAKQNNLWSDYYPMATVEEYFAVGTAVYFNVDHLRYRGTGNHMDLCNGNNFCSSEYESRTHLYRIDNNLYNILTHVFTSNQPGYYPNIGICGQSCT